MAVTRTAPSGNSASITLTAGDAVSPSAASVVLTAGDAPTPSAAALTVASAASYPSSGATLTLTASGTGLANVAILVADEDEAIVSINSPASLKVSVDYAPPSSIDEHDITIVNVTMDTPTVTDGKPTS